VLLLWRARAPALRGVSLDRDSRDGAENVALVDAQRRIRHDSPGASIEFALGATGGRRGNVRRADDSPMTSAPRSSANGDQLAIKRINLIERQTSVHQRA